MQLSIGMTDLVKVELTPFGEAVLAKHRLKCFKRIGGSLKRNVSNYPEEIDSQQIFHFPKLDNDDAYTFYFHEIMGIFGKFFDHKSQRSVFKEDKIIWLCDHSCHQEENESEFALEVF